ncbi:MAG: thioesterase [Bacteroidales bacterium]|nr:thioesterase [Bacteroidales bacterium]MDD4670627.1 thioesterase [Bacteroidales bacterium]
MNKGYEETFRVKCYEVDPMMNLKAFSFMNAAQEIAQKSAEQMGCGYYELIENNNVWVISRAKVKYIKAPKWFDTVTLETWHKREEGLFALRDFELRDAVGNPAIVATTSWLIMNMESRRVQRTDHIITDEMHRLSIDKDAIAESCGKIQTPEHQEFVMTRRINVSDIDYNLHANNAKYLEWVMDCIDIEILKTREIDEFQINYNAESKIHDTVDMFRCKISESEYYVEGRRDGKNLFQTIIKFKD